MVRPFSRSKRTPVRLRHKIEKASAAKQKKQRKLAKKNPEWRSRLKKDPGIPNLFPFKDKILAEIEERKRQKAEEAQRRRDAAAGRKATVEPLPEDEDDLMEEEDDEMIEDDESDIQDTDDKAPDANPMAALLASAAARATEYGNGDIAGDMDDLDEEDDLNDGGVQLSAHMSTNYRNPEMSRKAFDKIFKQVLESADVVLYVLDARDPEGTRSKEVERRIMAADSGSKRLILVLNKIDLVPSKVLQAWLKHLRRYFPTIPIRASTPASNAQTFDHGTLTQRATAESLLRSLKAYANSKQLKRSIAVGVIGYPNVGKSSVINSLTSRLNKGIKSSACPVGAEAGVTTSLREVKVDNKLKVIDSPGIVFPSTVDDNTESKGQQRVGQEARLLLLNALPPTQISDPIPAVKLLLERMSQTTVLFEKLLQQYGITALGPFAQGDQTTDFLVQVARKRGRLGKGGVPSLHAAAMTVITDWRDGRIQGWTGAPKIEVAEDTQMSGEQDDGVPTGLDRKEIVKEWSEELRLDYSFLDGNG